MLWLLPIAFLGIAFLYASAGFGGGSTYIAILAIAGLPLSAIPVLSLSCNLIVSGQGAWLLTRSGHARWRLMSPLLIGSIPAAYLGGAWRLSGATFLLILTCSLTTAGVALLWQPTRKDPPVNKDTKFQWPKSLVLGAILGLVSGLSGIGGGIFLAPALHFLRWETARPISSAASIFIALNSAAGLVGQLSKGFGNLDGIPTILFFLCPLAVWIGGRMGTQNLIKRFSEGYIRKLTAIVILLVATRLWLHILL